MSVWFCMKQVACKHVWSTSCKEHLEEAVLVWLFTKTCVQTSVKYSTRPARFHCVSVCKVIALSKGLYGVFCFSLCVPNGTQHMAQVAAAPKMLRISSHCSGMSPCYGSSAKPISIAAQNCSTSLDLPRSELFPAVVAAEPSAHRRPTQKWFWWVAIYGRILAAMIAWQATLSVLPKQPTNFEAMIETYSSLSCAFIMFHCILRQVPYYPYCLQTKLGRNLFGRTRRWWRHRCLDHWKIPITWYGQWLRNAGGCCHVVATGLLVCWLQNWRWLLDAKTPLYQAEYPRSYPKHTMDADLRWRSGRTGRCRGSRRHRNLDSQWLSAVKHSHSDAMQ